MICKIGFENIIGVVCYEDLIDLLFELVDVVFICDMYYYFEYFI